MKNNYIVHVNDIIINLVPRSLRVIFFNDSYTLTELTDLNWINTRALFLLIFLLLREFYNFFLGFHAWFNNPHKYFKHSHKYFMQILKIVLNLLEFAWLHVLSLRFQLFKAIGRVINLVVHRYRIQYINFLYSSE
jgi:hypothetical protein